MTPEIVLFGLFILIIALTPLIFFVVQQQSIAVVERFGRFSRVARPGLNMKIPFIERVAGKMNLRIRQLDVEIETKTEDNVFLVMTVSVQYRALENSIYEAFYVLEDAEGQICSYIFDVVRAKVPKIKLDDVFSKKDDIADSVQEELNDVMTSFGYTILKSLVTDIAPDAKVKAAMNEINESLRLRYAAAERGEAEKILKIKQAEAESQSKILQGEGLAGQRKAIIEGIRDSVSAFQDRVDGANANDIMQLIILSQYFDTLKDIGAESQTNTIMVPHSPSAVQQFYDSLRDTLIAAKKT